MRKRADLALEPEARDVTNGVNWKTIGGLDLRIPEPVRPKDPHVDDPDGGNGDNGSGNPTNPYGAGTNPVTAQNTASAAAPKDTADSGFRYEDAPSYVSKYQSQIDSLANGILNRPVFSYDPENDPVYQQYRDSYTRNGRRAMEDTLGQVSARTGGLASSYAETAAQQTYDNYMDALADKIPELRQLAYEMYRDEGNTMYNNLSLLQGLENSEYGRYQDALGQYNTDRGFDYGLYSDEWGRAQDRAAMLGSIGDFSGYRALGYTDDEIARLQAAYQREQAAARYSGGGSSGNKSGAGSANKKDQQSDAYKAVSKKAGSYDDPLEAKAYLENMVNGNYITEDEAAYIYQVELGGTVEPEAAPPSREEFVEASGGPGHNYQRFLDMWNAKNK